jgi:hypothetical protein
MKLVPTSGPQDGDRIQSPKYYVLNKKQDKVLDEIRATDNAQKPIVTIISGV